MKTYLFGVELFGKKDSIGRGLETVCIGKQEKNYELHHQLPWCFVMEFRPSPEVHKMCTLQLMQTRSPCREITRACQRYSEAFVMVLPLT